VVGDLSEESSAEVFDVPSSFLQRAYELMFELENETLLSLSMTTVFIRLI
jgi:hypothetical protein